MTAKAGWVLSGCMLLGACSPTPGPAAEGGDAGPGSTTPDAAGGRTDGGALSDAARPPDAATPVDASVMRDGSAPPDAGTAQDAAIARDASIGLDAATPTDAAVVRLDAGSPPDAAMPDAGGDPRGQVLQTLTHTFDNQTYAVRLLKLPNAAGGFSYAQWIEPQGTGPKPVMLLMHPYDGIDWTGEEVDQRWATQHPSPALGTYPDVDAPGYDGTGTCAYAFTTPETVATSANIHLLNDMGVLAVFGRFYAGGSIENDVEDVLAGIRFLRTEPRADTTAMAMVGTSWGGFLALYGAAAAPVDATPVAVAAVSPASDLEALARHVTQDLPSLITDPMSLAYTQGFFQAYLRRIVATTGGLPGTPGADFTGYNRAALVADLRSETLLVHDAWDTLIPAGLSSDLAADLPQRVALLVYPEPAPLDWNNAPFSHGALLDETIYPSVNTWALAFLFTRMAPTTQPLVIIHAAQRMHEYLVRNRAAQLQGMDNAFLAPRLADLTDPRVVMADLTPGANLATTAGATYVADEMLAVHGQSTLPGAPGGGSCTPWSQPPPDAGTAGGCPTQSPDAVGLPPVVDNNMDGTTVYRNLAYGTRGGRVLQGDLYVPAPTAATPSGVLVVVHGGGWVDCDHRRDATAAFANGIMSGLGVATFNVEYRLVQEGGEYPENLMDIKCAIQWAHANAGTYGLDGTRISLTGESAGGHLVALAGLTQDRTDLDPQCGSLPPTVDAVLSYSGPYDLPLMSVTAQPGIQNAVVANAGTCVRVESCANGRACNRCVDASPVRHAVGALPEFMLVHAPDTFDQLVPLTQAQLLNQTLLFAGASSQLLVPSDDEMVAQGCQPNDAVLQAHGFSACLFFPTATASVDLILRHVGPF